jgi:3-oxoacyl-[acyl-carrier protein] reductase
MIEMEKLSTQDTPNPYSYFQDKNFIITGGTRGIGKKIVEELLRYHAGVILTYRGANTAAENEKKFLIEKFPQAKNKIHLVELDLAQFGNDQSKISWNHFFDQNKDLVISGLVNNAGVAKDNIAIRTKIEDLDLMINTNLRGTILFTNFILKNLLKNKNDSSIVNISSIVGLMGNSYQSIYSATKSGLIGFTKTIAKEYASKKIRCNVICPGFIETEMTENLSTDIKAEYLKGIPMGRYGKSEEVANLVLFLLNHHTSSYLTGNVIKIAGGMSM